MMLKRTNINITDGTAIMPYLVEYLDVTNEDNTTYSIWYHRNEDKRECWLDIVGLEEEHEHLYARENYWQELEKDEYWYQWNAGEASDDLPIALLKVYFPQYSVETYADHIYYIVKLTTYTQDWKVNIGCYLTNRIDSLACAPVKFLDNEYFEYQYYNIPDIWAILYSEAFKSLRQNILYGNIDASNSDETNDDCSLFSIEIIPATKEDAYYVKHETYFSSENAIEISKGDSDFMNLTIKQSFSNDYIPQIHAQLNFNDVYENNLTDYLVETYSIPRTAITAGKIWVDYCLSAMNEDDIFKMQEIRKNANQLDCIIADFSGSTLQFENWAYLNKMISFNCIACITYRNNESDEGTILMEIKSTSLPITQDIYRWWINRNTIDNTINHINIEDNDMNILACNKIVKNIVTVPRPDNYKANIMKPVFFKSYDVEQIYIYSNANCTIAINLTKYYAQVEYFKIQIGDFTVQEYGRNASGVLFKIDAVMLDKSVESGIYYILDNNDEVVADGRYTFKDLVERRLSAEQATESPEIKPVKKPVLTINKDLTVTVPKNDMMIPRTFKENASPTKTATITNIPIKFKI